MNHIEEVSDDMLMALADNELPDAEATVLRALVATSPDLRRRLAVYEDTRRMLQAAFPPEPVPMTLVQAVLDTNATEPQKIVPLVRQRAALPSGWGMAMAASLVIAMGVGGFLAGRSTVPDQMATGLDAASLALAQVPTGGQATLADGSVARVLASYQTDLGLCRLIGTDASRAITCRDGDAWHVAVSVAATGDGAFLPASDLGTALIDQLLDDIAASAALDPAQEQQALAP